MQHKNYHVSENPNLRENTHTQAHTEAIKAEGTQRQPGPGQYRSYKSRGLAQDNMEANIGRLATR